MVEIGQKFADASSADVVLWCETFFSAALGGVMMCCVDYVEADIDILLSECRQAESAHLLMMVANTFSTCPQDSHSIQALPLIRTFLSHASPPPLTDHATTVIPW